MSAGDDPFIATNKRKWATKTKMCWHYPTGNCLLGDHCNFAHSADELRPKPDLRRLDMCAFAEQGLPCVRGTTCAFSHTEKELLEMRAEFYRVSKKLPDLTPHPSAKATVPVAATSPSDLRATAGSGGATAGVEVGQQQSQDPPPESGANPSSDPVPVSAPSYVAPPHGTAASSSARATHQAAPSSSTTAAVAAARAAGAPAGVREQPPLVSRPANTGAAASSLPPASVAETAAAAAISASVPPRPFPPYSNSRVFQFQEPQMIPPAYPSFPASSPAFHDMSSSSFPAPQYGRRPPNRQAYPSSLDISSASEPISQPFTQPAARPFFDPFDARGNPRALGDGNRGGGRGTQREYDPYAPSLLSDPQARTSATTLHPPYPFSTGSQPHPMPVAAAAAASVASVTGAVPYPHTGSHSGFGEVAAWTLAGHRDKEAMSSRCVGLGGGMEEEMGGETMDIMEMGEVVMATEMGGAVMGVETGEGPQGTRWNRVVPVESARHGYNNHRFPPSSPHPHKCLPPYNSSTILILRQLRKEAGRGRGSPQTRTPPLSLRLLLPTSLLRLNPITRLLGEVPLGVVGEGLRQHLLLLLLVVVHLVTPLCLRLGQWGHWGPVPRRFLGGGHPTPERTQAQAEGDH
uniref:C3H1-type domain-containing protein n=1 Tax=Chromera velia CCMP2878 TaxID=1169474 RepID=A0A0G4GWG6_9ALVE|eukprot:Cvel_23604.t1-p1 / transcript=Cvel_23604.t1 / gene=Cvel_23604 / organism=Chromera_velia_CCMP2878 / gene_product=hypothetical protein / transcript_product=hypothetical protein / location=Cvel_scaffold2451:6399-8916(+) / protein_length=632 / sequence_SO=supercontig / SO=protein_coding / is_pseudo=false